VSPSYPESVGFAPGHNEHGFLRSPTDFAPARLFDAPSSPRPQIKYAFETVARGMDNQAFYGGIDWGFEIVGGAVNGASEYARPIAATSTEFDLSLERFRAFFTHEPTIIYFDTNLAIPAAGEDAKLAEAMTWLGEFSDAHVEIEGFADERGPTGPNIGLSQRRADAVAAELIGRGLDPGRVDFSTGRGETTAFAGGAQAGQLQANRRARIRFVRNASTPPGP
jgi:outer membrane protein OmpA-like peptidoglycan-associated protein